jgi:hypothetical protein
MFNIVVPNLLATKTYMESPQANPMRWQWMYREKQTLTAQAGLMRCKDFFNDLVAKRHGHDIQVYGLNTDGLKFNRYGLYVLLTDVLADTIIANIETAINPKMKEDIGKTIKCFKQSSNSVVIRMPLEIFDSTYRTSLTTMLIRLSNYDVRFDSFDDFYTPKSALNKTEMSLSPRAQKLTQHFGFKLPKDEWYLSSDGFCGSGHKPIVASIIHNNGCTDWARSLDMVDFQY